MELKIYTMEVGYRERTGTQGDSAFVGDDGNWYVPPLGLLPSSAQGFVVCLGSSAEPMASFYAFPYRRKVWPSDIPVLRVARPILRAHKTWESYTARNLLLATRLVAKTCGLSTVEIEAYRGVWGPIFFPSSPTAMDAANDPEFVKALGLRRGVPAPVWTTVGVDLGGGSDAAAAGGVLDRLPDPPRGLTLRPMRRGHAEDRETYNRLWIESGVLPLNPNARAPRFGGWQELRPWYDDVASLLGRENFVLLAEAGGTPVGFVHWWPNLYEIAARHGRAAAGLPAERARELTAEVGEAKVFKLAVLPKAGGGKGSVGQALVAAALRVMAQDYGVHRAQVVARPEDAALKDWLKGLGGKTVQEMAVLTMRA